MSYRSAFRGCCGPRESWGDVYYGNDPAKQNWQKINSLSEVGMFAGGEIEWYYPAAYSDQRSEQTQHSRGAMQLFVLNDGSSVSYLPHGAWAEFLTGRQPEGIGGFIGGTEPEIIVADAYGEVQYKHVAHLPGGLGSIGGVRWNNWGPGARATYPQSWLCAFTVPTGGKVVSVWKSMIKGPGETTDPEDIDYYDPWGPRLWVQSRGLDNVIEWEVPIPHYRMQIGQAGTIVRRPGSNLWGTGLHESVSGVMIAAGREGEVIVADNQRQAANKWRSGDDEREVTYNQIFGYDAGGQLLWQSNPFDGQLELNVATWSRSYERPAPQHMECDADGNPWVVIKDRNQTETTVDDNWALYKLSRSDGSKMFKVLLTQHTSITELVPDRAGGMYVHGGGTLTKFTASGSIAWTMPGHTVITEMDRVCSVSSDNKTLWGVGSGFSFRDRPSRVQPRKEVPVGDVQLPVFIDVSGAGPPTMESRCGVLYDDDPTLPAMFGSSSPAKILGWAEVVKCFPGEPAPFG